MACNRLRYWSNEQLLINLTLFQILGKKFPA